MSPPPLNILLLPLIKVYELQLALWEGLLRL